MTSVIVVTGGSSGIGAAAVARFLATGAEVWNLDRRAPQHAEVRHLDCDLSDPGAIDNAISALPRTIHALVQVAGVAVAQPQQHVIAINFLAQRHLLQALLPRLLSGGAVVNVASSAARDWRDHADALAGLLATDDFRAGEAWLAAHPDLWQSQPYVFSKRCAAAWTYRAAGMARARGVRVNCVNPGTTRTALSDEFRGMLGPERYDWVVAQLGRAGRPEDIAPVIEFLATGPCPWLNGVEILVDGGYVAGLVGGWIDLDQAPPLRA